MALTEWITLRLLPETESLLSKDMTKAAASGVDAMDKEFRRKSADLKADLASGLIDEKEYARMGARAANAYNREIVAKMDALKKAGKDTTAEYAALGDKIKSVSTSGAEHAGLIGRAWGGFKNMIVGFGPAIAAAFGVNAIVNFAKESIGAAAESEKAWADVKVTLGNLGVPLAKATAEVEAAANKMMRTTRFGDEETIRGFNKVLQMTGDYGKSLKALGPIADLAIAKNISYEQASTIVGKALAGNDAALRKLIPTMEKGGDVFQALGKFAGAAAADANTFTGQSAMLGNAFGELQESIGKVLISGGQGAGIMEMFTAAIVELTDWVEKNKNEIQFWIGQILRFVQVLVPIIVNAIGGAINWLQTEWYGLMTVFHAGVGVFFEIKAAVLEFAKTVTGAMIPVMETLEKIARKLGFKESADDFHAAAANLTKDFNNLAVQRREALREVETQQEKVRENATKMGENFKQVGGNIKAGIMEGGKALDVLIAKGKEGVQSADDMGTAHTDAASNTSKAWSGAAGTVNGKQKEMSAAAKKAAGEMSAAYNNFTGSILAGNAEVTASYKEMQKQAGEQAAAVATAQQNVQSAYIRTGDASQQAGSAIEQATREATIAKQAERDAIQASHDATKDYAYDYVTVYTPAIEQRTDKVTKALEKQGEAGEAAADTTEKAWVKSLALITGGVQALGTMFGGVFGKLGGLMTTANSGVATFAASWDVLKDKAAKFLDKVGAIGAAMGAGSAIGGAISSITGGSSKGASIGGAVGGGIGTAIGGPVGGIIGSAIGGVIGGFFKGSKDPGRLKGNDEAYAAALGGDAGALEFLKAHSLAEVGGGGGWATNNAKRDATEKWISALRKGAIHGDAEALAELRRLYKALETYGGDAKIEGTNTTYRQWAMAVRGGIPQGVPGFQMGGLVQATGIAQVHRGELVIPEYLTQQILALGGRGGTNSTSNAWDNRQVVVNQVFHGVQDRDIPRLAVEGIKAAIARDFKVSTALEGNTRLPQ